MKQKTKHALTGFTHVIAAAAPETDLSLITVNWGSILFLRRCGHRALGTLDGLTHVV